MLHAHMAFWVVGAPRIDKIQVPREKTTEGEQSGWVEIESLPEGGEVTPTCEAAARLASFWERALTEFNYAKAMAVNGPASSNSSGAEAWAGFVKSADNGGCPPRPLEV